jgi:Flp pilus assembly protein TadG
MLGAKDKKSRGQSLVEFALILPILLLLVLGAMDIGRIITTKIAVTNAAREGANFLSRNVLLDDVVNNDDLTATCNVVTQEGRSTDSLIVNVIIECDEIDITGCCTEGDPVIVTVTKEVDLIYGNILEFLGSISGPLEIASSVQMRVK